MTLKQKSQALVLLALCSFSTLLTALEEGDLAPIFDLPSIYADHPAITTASLEGKTVYVDFWASWCAPCLVSLPLYNDIYHKYKEQGLEIVAINVDNPTKDGLDFLSDTPLDFLIPADPDGDAAELFEVIGMPTSYLIEPDGSISLVHMGFRKGDIEIIEEAIQNSLTNN